MHWFSANYKWLFGGVGGSVLIAIVVFVLRRVFRSNASPPTPSINNNSAQTASPSMDNRATLTASPSMETSVNINVQAQTSPEPQPQPQQTAPDSATLSPLRAREVFVYDDQYGIWKETPNNFAGAHKGIVLPFNNMPKELGQRTPRADNVSASLEFKNVDGSQEQHISHGVWEGHFQYSSIFNPSETHDLLVALKKDESFVTLENPNPYNPFTGGRYFRTRPDFGYPQTKTVWNEGTVEIVLVDGHGITMFQGVFDYQLSGEKMALTPKNLASGGKVHFVPDQYNLGWAGNDGRTDVLAAGIFTYDGAGMLTIIDAFLKGTTPKVPMMASVLTADGRGPVVSVNSLELPGRTPVRAVLNLVSEPVNFERGKSVCGQLVLRDIYNKEYEIDSVDFPWIGPKASR